MSAPTLEAPPRGDEQGGPGGPGGPAGPRRRAVRAPRAPRGPVEGPAAIVSSVSTMVALLTVWVILHLLVLGHVSHARSQDLLHRDFRGQLASATAPVDGTASPGSPVAILTIPRLGFEQVVVEGTGPSDLFAGPGHKRNTVLPGQAGTSVVLGRAITYGGPFADIATLQRGDLVRTVTGQGRVTFRVISVRRGGDPLPQPRAAKAARVTLVTASGSGRLAGIRPEDTVFVDAEAAEALPTSARYARQVPASEEPMARGQNALPLLCLGLALLTALTVAVIVARQRWGLALVWVVAAPVTLAVAWFTTDAAMRLLPNLL